MENVAVLNWNFVRVPDFWKFFREIFSKSFGKKFLAMFMVLPLVLFASGCPSAQQWFQIVSALIPVVGQTYLQFYGFANRVDPADAALVNTLSTSAQDALSRISALVSTVKTNSGAPVVTQINTILAQLQQNVNGFLADAQIKNSAHFAEYNQYAQEILTDISDIVAIIPVVTAITSPSTAKANQAKFSKATSLKGVFEERLARLPK